MTNEQRKKCSQTTHKLSQKQRTNCLTNNAQNRLKNNAQTAQQTTQKKVYKQRTNCPTNKVKPVQQTTQNRYTNAINNEQHHPAKPWMIKAENFCTNN